MRGSLRVSTLRTSKVWKNSRQVTGFASPRANMLSRITSASIGKPTPATE
jgi:hypothetical protein